MRKMDMQKQIAEAGVVGAGGAGFPTHMKIKSHIETILINGTECEPLLKTDFYLLKEYRQTLENVLNYLCDSLNIRSGVIGIKKHTGALLSIKDGERVGKVVYKLVGDVYPAGDEIVLIKDALHKAVPAGGLPVSVSTVVLNVETLLNIGNAIEGTPVTDKFITIAGDTDKTIILKIPIGTPVSDIFDKLGIAVGDKITVLDGGPMMGNIINPHTAVITKTTKGILLLDSNTFAVKKKKMNLLTSVNRASGSCCGCRMCTDLCPRYLMGYPIQPHKILAAFPNKIEDNQTYMGAFYCSNCGLCETVACPQNISPNKLFQRVKNDLLSKGTKGKFYHESLPLSLREYRKVPVSRLINRLGIKKYDRDDFVYKEISLPAKVEVPMKQHIGVLAEIVVNPNQKVKKGQVIGKMPEGKLGADIHAPVDGTVYACTENSVIIIV